MKLLCFILLLCTAYALALPAGVFPEDSVADQGTFPDTFIEVDAPTVQGKVETKAETSGDNPEVVIASQSDDPSLATPQAAVGSAKATRPLARPLSSRRQNTATSDVATSAGNAEAPAAPAPVVAGPRRLGGKIPLRAAPAGTEEEGMPKSGRSDAGLHEFLKRRRQERILATTEADPLAVLRKDESEVSAPESKPSGKSFGSSRRTSSSNRKTETTTTTSTTTAKPARNSNGGNRFGSSALSRKNNRASATTEAPASDKAEDTAEPSAKPKPLPKRFSKKN